MRIRDGVVNEIIKHGLTKTQTKVFFYFTQLDRFGDRSAKFDLASALEVMGIGKTAYYAAIAFFKNKGWMDIPERSERVTYVSNNCVPGKFANTDSQPSANTDSDFVNTNSQSANTDSDFANTNRGFAKTNSQSEKTKSKRLKPFASKRSATPQTNSDLNSDLNQTNQTLSKGKRERNEFLWKNTFDAGDRRQLSYFAYQVVIPKLPTKPALPDAWIVCNCQELYNQMMYDVEFQKKWEQLSGNSPVVEIHDTPESEPRDTVDW